MSVHCWAGLLDCFFVLLVQAVSCLLSQGVVFLFFVLCFWIMFYSGQTFLLASSRSKDPRFDVNPHHTNMSCGCSFIRFLGL